MLFQLGFISESLDYILESLSETILKIVIGIIIFLVGFVIGKLLGRLLYKILNEIEINKFIKNSTGLKINADHLISNILSYAIYFLSLVAALEQIGIANIILYLLSAAVILIILISFFVGVRDFLPNLIAGIYLYRKQGMKEGSYIEVKEIKGELMHIDLFQTKIKTKSGDILFLPNSVVANSKVKIKKKSVK